MKLPAAFKQTIKNVFYDKQIILYTTQDTIDADGWARKAGTTVVAGSFMGNVSFENLGKVQEDYGLLEKVTMTITTDQNIPTDTIIGYLGRQHIVRVSEPNDSHYYLVTQEWSSKSSTLISA